MNRERIKPGQVLSAVVNEGAGFVSSQFYRVIRVNRVTVTVETERGEIKRVHPQWFDSIAGFDWPIK